MLSSISEGLTALGMCSFNFNAVLLLLYMYVSELVLTDRQVVHVPDIFPAIWYCYLGTCTINVVISVGPKYRGVSSFWLKLMVLN